jgi:methylmalonyl-CoA mutase N-terminal domain/subunit
MEAAAYDYFHRIDELGGMVVAVERNFPQREIADAAFQLQSEIDGGERVVVGVNRYADDDEELIPTLRIDAALEQKQIDRVKAVRGRRDASGVESALGALKTAAAREGENLMPALIEAARARATEGEMIEALQEVFGTYTETPVF